MFILGWLKSGRLFLLRSTHTHAHAHARTHTHAHAHTHTHTHTVVSQDPTCKNFAVQNELWVLQCTPNFPPNSTCDLNNTSSMQGRVEWCIAGGVGWSVCLRNGSRTESGVGTQTKNDVKKISVNTTTNELEIFEVSRTFNGSRINCTVISSTGENCGMEELHLIVHRLSCK